MESRSKVFTGSPEFRSSAPTRMWRVSVTSPSRGTFSRNTQRPEWAGNKKPLRISVFVESKNDSERLNRQEHQPRYNQILMWNSVGFSHAYLNIRAWHHLKQTLSRLKSHPEIGRRASDRPARKRKDTIPKMKSNITVFKKATEEMLLTEKSFEWVAAAGLCNLWVIRKNNYWDWVEPHPAFSEFN